MFSLKKLFGEMDPSLEYSPEKDLEELSNSNKLIQVLHDQLTAQESELRYLRQSVVAAREQNGILQQISVSMKAPNQ